MAAMAYNLRKILKQQRRNPHLGGVAGTPNLKQVYLTISSYFQRLFSQEKSDSKLQLDFNTV